MKYTSATQFDICQMTNRRLLYLVIFLLSNAVEAYTFEIHYVIPVFVIFSDIL